MRLPMLLASMAAVETLAESLGVRLITYNVRFDTDNLEDGEEPWSTRLPHMADQLNGQIDESANLLMCTQEPFRSQLEDLQAKFNGPWWDFLGWGREGGRSGEYSSLWYQDEIWEKTDEKTYWFTEELENGNNENIDVGWDATHPRTMNIARLKHRATGVAIVYGCAHVDYEGTKAAEESGKWIDIIAERWAEDGKYPVFVGVDLNWGEDTQPYKNIVAGMTDIKKEVPNKGFTWTYTGFNGDEDDNELIDFIFVKDKSMVNLIDYNVLNNKPGDTYISDHRPVVVNLKVDY